MFRISGRSYDEDGCLICGSCNNKDEEWTNSKYNLIELFKILNKSELILDDNVNDLVSYLSSQFEIENGDLK